MENKRRFRAVLKVRIYDCGNRSATHLNQVVEYRYSSPVRVSSEQAGTRSGQVSCYHRLVHQHMNSAQELEAQRPKPEPRATLKLRLLNRQ